MREFKETLQGANDYDDDGDEERPRAKPVP
jgi:hypothetical protein